MAGAVRKRETFDDPARGGMTADEFWQMPPSADGTKYELVDGQLRAMSPASHAHGLIQANLARVIGNRLADHGGPCRVATEPAIAVRVRSRSNGRIPDLGISCTPNQLGMLEMPDPVALIEILSAGNRDETWDNVWAYTSIPSLREIVVISSFAVAASYLVRNGDGDWPEDPEPVASGDTLRLETISFACALDDIYAGTFLAE